MNMADARAALERHFGYVTFRPGQEGIIAAVLGGRDALAVMPTGAGKSICYQIPGVLLPGLTLVVSPLVSLMGDQVRGLLEAGIRGSFLNSSLTVGQQATVMQRALGGAYDIMYVAPERLEDPRFRDFCQQAAIPLVAVDEAHCVSQWGQDFRPSYLGIGEFVSSLPRRPRLLALTATATERVRDDIARMLGLHDPYRIVTGFDRPNLRFSVEHLEEKRKLERIIERVGDSPADSGIIYCSTRKDTELVHEALVDQGIRATRYHAGISSAERAKNQRAFINDDAPVMVATNAFGMGIDKSNVRYVIHHNLPSSLEAYYQEAGRAGRDGEPSECLLLWNDHDIATCRFFIEGECENEALTFEEREVVRQTQRRLLSIMTGYCLTTECLRAYILSYFGDEKVSPRDEVGSGERQRESEKAVDAAGPAGFARANCGNCSNCLGEIDAVDVTETALGLLRCVQELRGRFGKGVIVDVVRGANTQRIRDFGLNRTRYYNTLGVSAPQLKEIIELLASQGYLEITEGKFPLVGLGPRAREAAEPGFELKMKRVRKSKKSRSRSGGASFGDTRMRTFGSVGITAGVGGHASDVASLGDVFDPSLGSRVYGSASDYATLAFDADGIISDEELFERLRVLRKFLADAAGKPPYIVFNDATLRDMCIRRPVTEEEFLEVNGVGETKLKRYGKQFLAEIAQSLGMSSLEGQDVSE